MGHRRAGERDRAETGQWFGGSLSGAKRVRKEDSRRGLTDCVMRLLGVGNHGEIGTEGYRLDNSNVFIANVTPHNVVRRDLENDRTPSSSLKM